MLFFIFSPWTAYHQTLQSPQMIGSLSHFTRFFKLCDRWSLMIIEIGHGSIISQYHSVPTKTSWVGFSHPFPSISSHFCKNAMGVQPKHAWPGQFERLQIRKDGLHPHQGLSGGRSPCRVARPGARRHGQIGGTYTLVKSYLLKVFLFFIFFAMLVFGFWGWDSTNLALGTHGVTWTFWC